MEWVILVSLSLVLGVYHGINPSMGWLFPLFLALKHRKASITIIASLAIALGHSVSTAILMTSITFLGIVVGWGLQLAGVLLILLGIYRVFRPQQHRYVGLSLGLASMFLWGFFTAFAHGSGLALVPVAEGLRTSGICGPTEDYLTSTTISVALPLAIHAISFLVTSSTIALLAYKLLGTALVRTVWRLNYDLLWSLSIIVIGITLLLSSLLSSHLK